MDFHDNGRDLDACLNSEGNKYKTDLEYCCQFLAANNFNKIEVSEVQELPYAVYQHKVDQNFFIEFCTDDINIIFDHRTGDFVTIPYNNYYGLLGALIHHQKLSFFANKIN